MSEVTVDWEAAPRKAVITAEGTEISSEIIQMYLTFAPEGAKLTIYRTRIIDGREWDTTDEYDLGKVTITAEGARV
jgi:hypothetical protein